MATIDDRIVQFNANRKQGMKQLEAYAKAFNLPEGFNRKQVVEQACRYAKRKDVQDNYNEMTAEVHERVILQSVDLRTELLNGLHKMFKITTGEIEEEYEDKMLIEYEDGSSEEKVVAKGSKRRVQPKLAAEIANTINKMQGYNQEKPVAEISNVIIVDNI
jgi:hypothetical protein